MIRVRKHNFTDAHNRTLLLRGVNLGGTSKIPASPRVDLYDPRFYNERLVSFVGRPFPLEQADEHLRRLRGWGLTFLRFVVTWEALEHAGPGIYDNEYIEYLRAVLTRAGEYGFHAVIDPHQDVWSRFTGGGWRTWLDVGTSWF